MKISSEEIIAVSCKIRKILAEISTLDVRENGVNLQFAIDLNRVDYTTSAVRAIEAEYLRGDESDDEEKKRLRMVCEAVYYSENVFSVADTPVFALEPDALEVALAKVPVEIYRDCEHIDAGCLECEDDEEYDETEETFDWSSEGSVEDHFNPW